MTFLNTWEVDELQNNFRHDPILGPAAQFLADYRDTIQDNSDGWAYWAYGRNCTKDLVTILSAAKSNIYRSFDGEYVSPTRKDVEKACAKITRFVKTNPRAATLTAPTLTWKD